MVFRDQTFAISDSKMGSRAPFVAVWFAIVLFTCLAFAWLAQLVLGADLLAWTIAIFVSVGAFVFLLWLSSPTRGFARIELGALHAQLPRGRFTRRKSTVHYADIRTVAILRHVGAKRIVIDADGVMPIAYALSWFDDDRLAKEFAAELLRRVDSSGMSERLLAGVRERKALAEFVSEMPVWVSLVLTVLMTAIFVGQIARGTVMNVFDTMRMGANASWLLPDGGWYRLATSNFIHFGPTHLPGNLLAFAIVGPALERLLGGRRYVLILLGSGLGAALATGLVSVKISQGFSGVICGLVGTLLMLNVLHREKLPPPYRLVVRFVVLAAVLTVVVEVVVPNVDSKAHIGGLLTGGLLSFLVLRGQDLRQLAVAPLHGAMSTLVFGICLFYAAGLARGTHEAFTTTIVEMKRSLAAVARVPPFDPGTVEWSALMLVASPDATREDVLWMRAKMQEVLGREERNVLAIDALALAMYRLGDLEAACRLQREVLELWPNSSRFARLAKYDYERLRASEDEFANWPEAASVTLSTASNGSPSLEWVVRVQPMSDAEKVSPKGEAQRLVVDALIVAGGDLFGLVRSVAVERPGSAWITPADGEFVRKLPPNARFEVVHVQSSPAAADSSGPSAPELHAYRVDPNADWLVNFPTQLASAD